MSDIGQFLKDKMTGGSSPLEAVQALKSAYPSLSLTDVAGAIINAKKDATLGQVMKVKSEALMAASGADSAAVATAEDDVVLDAAFTANLLLGYDPQATPAQIADALMQTYHLNPNQMAQVLRYGEPLPVFPSISAGDMILTLKNVWSNIDTSGLIDALKAAGYSQQEIDAAIHQPFTWVKHANVAQYKGASWDNLVKRVSGTTVEAAMQIADADPNITFFFYMRQGMFLEGKSGPGGWTQKGSFAPGDAVFFSGKPWFGSAPQADAYVKQFS